MTHDMKRNIQMRNMEFTERKQLSGVMADSIVQPDLQSGCKEYKDLQSDRRMANAYIHGERIANPLERETAYLQDGNNILPSRRLHSLLLLLVLTLGTTTSWGQTGTDYSGVYYFVNCGSGKTDLNDFKIEDITGPDDYFYLVPADNPQQGNKRDAWFSSNYSTANGDPEKPYLTTYKTKKDAAEVPEGVTNRSHNSVWIVKFASTDSGTDYYYLIHAATGKYVVYEPPYSAKPNRKAMHLLTTDSPGENAKFAITTADPTRSNYFNFRVKSLTSGNRFLNPTNANYNFYYSSDGTADGVANYFRGLVGLYQNKNNDGKTDASASDWKPEPTLLPAPTIDYVFETNTFTISYDQLPSGYTILYTIDESEPTIGGATTSTYDGSPVLLTGSSKTVKAAVARYGLVLTEVAILEPCVTPVISYDYTTSMVSITCATPSSNIYYTVNGGNPTVLSPEYSESFSVTTPTTIKAFATHATLPPSAVAELAISQVATPTIQNNGSNAISITTETPGATIYYTTDGSTPTTSSTEYTSPLTENVSNVTIKAIAVKENMITSAVGSGSVKLKCATPIITRDGMTFSISCSMPTDATLYYSLNNSTPSTEFSGPVSFTSEQLPMTVTAVAKHNDYTDSEYATFELLNGTGTSSDPYLIYGATDFTSFISDVNSGSTSSACYKLETDVDLSDISVDAITTTFTGTFDGGMHIISDLGHALFNTIYGGTVKNVILDNVTISGGTNAGAICNEAAGDCRIYNCGVLATDSEMAKDKEGYTSITSNSSTISGSGYVGGIVGLLDGSSRVINCFSYANITGGTHRGGIVGYNNVASTSGNLQTMVMNCMFYGDINTTGATQIAPAYCGQIIHNKRAANNNTGLNNYCYFLYDEEQNPYVKSITTYNGSLGAEKRFLSRFELFRLTLNSTRNMAAFYACGNVSEKNQMAKWVLDKSVAPYPILKFPGYYPSIVNPDAEHATDIDAENEHRNEGRKLGTLTVIINNIGSGAQFSAPTGAHLIDKNGNEVSSRSLTLNITDKDFANYNFNYKKIQLPYYCEVGTGNYTKASASDETGRVVTGWKITGFTNGTAGTFTNTGSEVTFDDDGNISTTPFNFVDRKCTNKDLYGTDGSNRVFNQGAYWEVPDGVTEITIEPYWAKAVYLSDANYDVTYSGTTKYGVTVGGTCPTTLGAQEQTVYTNMATAITNLAPAEGKTVYDYAVVLVGNYHHYTNNAPANDTKPFTIMSADLDGDHEPDNTLFYYHNSRKNVSPIRFDFLNMPGIGMVKRTYDATNNPEPGIFKPNGWFEITNTVFVRFGQFEYAEAGDASNSAYKAKKILAPLILQGGIYEQFVTSREKNSGLTNYLLVGGNAWFKNFANGCHTNTFSQTPKVPINVTGGDFENFYLTGIYQPNGNPNDEDAECYIDGGRFEEVAGAGMQRVDGNVTWLINGADITNFFGGGINDAQSITGNITTIISNSYVDEFYGGPKFGNMTEGKKVKTTATDCHFGKFFGAGYGGTSLNRVDCEDVTVAANASPTWSTYLNNHYTRSYEVTHTSYKSQGTQKTTTVNAISTSYDYEYIIHSDGSQTVARFYVNFASLSLASTRDVISKLTGCTIGVFYGGGRLGSVNGNTTSTLTDCTVTGNAFGAGFSADVPTVEVWPAGVGLSPLPEYNRKANVFNNANVKFPNEQEDHIADVHIYKWTNGHNLSTSNPFYDNDNNDGYYIYTSVSLDGLGAVNGNATLTLNGSTTVEGNVFGGGDEGVVQGSATVNIGETPSVTP